MAVHYSIKAIRVPGHPEQAPKYYAQAQVKEKVTLSQLAKEMTYGSCLKETTVVTVINALAVIMKEHLTNGNQVNLGEFGTFRCQIHGTGAASQEEFNPVTNIKGVKIQYSPGEFLKNDTKEIKFKQVIPIKVHREMRCQEKIKTKESQMKKEQYLK